MMSSNMLNEIVNRLDQVEKRLDNIENKNIPTKAVSPSTQPKISDHVEKKEILTTQHDRQTIKQNKKESHFLGYVGAACILLASILLIKLSIDSGWLTPIRQCMLASIFAGALIAFPFFIRLKDKSYISLLPALGIAVLHLTIYGAVFYHKLLDPILGLFLISLIGLLSLWLLTKLEEETYAALAIFGTYLGAFFFHTLFSQILTMALYLLAWDVIFSLFSIKLKKRLIIVITSYLALGLVTFFGLAKGYENYDFILSILIIQAIQFTLFSLATAFFSIKNKVSLTVTEAWTFFPVVMFFYGQEYFFLNRISENWATFFSVGFSIFLLAIYSLSKKKLHKEELDSGGVVYTTCSLIFTHAIFIVQMNDLARIIFSFGVVILLWMFQKKLTENKNLKGTLIVAIFIFLYSYISVLFGVGKISFEPLLVCGAIFGVILLVLSNKIEGSKATLVLNLGHAQVFMTLFRLKKLIGYFAIAPLWIAYAFGVLFWANRKKDKNMAKGAIPLIIIGLGRFIVFDFSKLSGGQQVISLLIMGGLIFAGGYLYRKVVRE